MSKPRYGSLFSGVGGIDLGLDRAGWECAFQVEIDPFARQVLEKHWPGVPKFDDIRKCYGQHRDSAAGGEVQWELPPVDLLCGGFP